MIRYRLKKKYAILAVVFAGLGLFLLVLGGSYAFFTNQVTSKDYVIYTGNLQIDYTRTGNLINLTKAYPKTNTEGLQEEGYSFNITNNGNIDARYQIRLELDNSNTLPLEYIKMAYIRTKSNSTQTDEEIEPILLSNLNNTLTFISDKQIGAGKEDSYNLKLWIDYNAPNDIQGKTFKATIVVDSLQDVEDGYAMADTPPIITLNKYSDGNTDSHILVNEQFTDPGILSVKDDKDLLTEEDVNIKYDYTSDGTNLSQVSGIDTTTPGVYYINYEVTDSDNLTASITRVVTVNNTPAIPTISLIGSNSITIEQYSTFTDPGVNVESNNKVAVIGEVKNIKPGIYTVRYIVIDKNGSLNSITRNVVVNEKTVWEFAFDPDGDGQGQAQTFETPCDGNYKIELWGASASSPRNNGLGGYTSGNIVLKKSDILYVYVGEEGKNAVPSSINNAYNGGGKGGLSTNNTSARNGGGATDIRYFGDNYTPTSSDLIWNSSTGLKSRIMVAGAAGGGSANELYSTAGGSSSGGGLIGSNGAYYSGHGDLKQYGAGGTQVSGGVAGKNISSATGTNYPGTFGIGGTSNSTSYWNGAGGGGAGYYGGGSGGSTQSSGAGNGAGGGSSFISGYSGCNAISESSTLSNIIHTGQPNHYSGYVFTNGVMIDGNGCNWSTGSAANCGANQPQPNGTNAVGHSGNGYARITYLGN